MALGDGWHLLEWTLEFERVQREQERLIETERQLRKVFVDTHLREYRRVLGWRWRAYRATRVNAQPVNRAPAAEEDIPAPPPAEAAEAAVTGQQPPVPPAAQPHTAQQRTRDASVQHDEPQAAEPHTRDASVQHDGADSDSETEPMVEDSTRPHPQEAENPANPALPRPPANNKAINRRNLRWGRPPELAQHHTRSQKRAS
jgi:hypothetical protein